MEQQELVAIFAGSIVSIVIAFVRSFEQFPELSSAQLQLVNTCAVLVASLSVFFYYQFALNQPIENLLTFLALSLVGNAVTYTTVKHVL